MITEKTILDVATRDDMTENTKLLLLGALVCLTFSSLFSAVIKRFVPKEK